MAVGLPLKTTYANGDVYSASDVNDTNGTINTTAAPYAAGKNKIINGDFRVWQRGTSFSVSGYNADRWTTLSLQAGDTTTQQTFTPGTAPVAGYEGLYYLRLSNSGLAGTRYFLQRIEDVRVLAGQTATLSFWAKASASATLTSVVGGQNFGSGGSSFNNGTSQANTLTTSWQRFTQTASISSVSGKTIGTGSYLELAFQFANTSVNYDIWGVQLEAGSTATAFQTATGTIQGELAACQRYYYRANAGQNYEIFGAGNSNTSTRGYAVVRLPVTMRIIPSALEYSTLFYGPYDIAGGGAVSALTITTNSNSLNNVSVTITNTGNTVNMYSSLYANNSSSAYLAFTAEL